MLANINKRNEHSDYKRKTIERGGTAQHPELTEDDKQKCLKAIRKL